MSASKIEWTEKTWNPVTGCNKVSQGCKNCYAEVMHKRLMVLKPEKYAHPFLDGAFPHEESLLLPLKWKKPTMVFVNSMSDLFHINVPFEFIDKVFAVMALTQWNTYQVLTKRPDRMLEYFNSRAIYHIVEATRFIHNKISAPKFSKLKRFANSIRDEFKPVDGSFPLPNVWVGTSCENQEVADERIPHLLEIDGPVRFLSCEPLLGKVDLSKWLNISTPLLPGAKIYYAIDWVITGGESGSDARPMHPEWPLLLRDQCKEAKVPFFFKQWGQYGNGSYLTSALNNNRVIVLNNGEMMEYSPLNESCELVKKYGRTWGSYSPCIMSKVGKKESGRTLDSYLYSQYPQEKKLVNA